jgi:hypothetical protein
MSTLEFAIGSRERWGMQAKFASLPENGEITVSELKFVPTHYFFPTWDKRSDPKVFQVAAGLTTERPGHKATLVNWGNRPLEMLKGGSVTGVAFYVGDENEYKRLLADYGKDYSLHVGRIVLDTGESISVAKFFELDNWNGGFYA